MTTYAQDSDGKIELYFTKNRQRLCHCVECNRIIPFLIFTGKYIPASQRPDGTWRKARRVKDGYVPQEEVPLYESKGKQFMKKPAIPVGMCPVVAQEAKAKRERQQLKQQQQKQTSANSIPGLIVLPTKTKQNTKSQNGQENSALSKKSTSASNKTNKSKSTKNSTLAASTNPSEKSLCDAVVNLSLTSAEEIAKKLKKLRKKIREIETIEEKLANGELKNPEQDQLDKVARKQHILNELQELESVNNEEWGAISKIETSREKNTIINTLAAKFYAFQF